MASLREMLEKQKAEKANGNVQKPSLSGNAEKRNVEIEIKKEENKEGKNYLQEQGGRPMVEQSRPLTLKEKIALKNAAAAKPQAQPCQPEVKAGVTSEPQSLKIENTSTDVVTTKEAQEKLNALTPKTETETPVDLAALRKNLDYLAANIDQKELVGDVVRTIYIQLKQNPALSPFMANADIDLVVRGLRRSYNIAARKKTEARETKQKKNAVDDAVAQAFKDAGLSF